MWLTKYKKFLKPLWTSLLYKTYNTFSKNKEERNFIMLILQALIIAIVEGITEFLPVIIYRAYDYR